MYLTADGWWLMVENLGAGGSCGRCYVKARTSDMDVDEHHFSGNARPGLGPELAVNEAAKGVMGL